MEAFVGTTGLLLAVLTIFAGVAVGGGPAPTFVAGGQATTATATTTVTQDPLASTPVEDRAELEAQFGCAAATRVIANWTQSAGSDVQQQAQAAQDAFSRAAADQRFTAAAAAFQRFADALTKWNGSGSAPEFDPEAAAEVLTACSPIQSQ